MNFRKTILAALVFLLLGGYLYFFEAHKEPGQKGERLLTFEQKEVESLELLYPDREFRLKKEANGNWRMIHPLETAADPITVAGVLSALHSAPIDRILEEKPEEKDLQPFGLDKPQIKVSIALANGKTPPAILVGAKTPVGNSAYVRRENAPAVLLTPASLVASLEKTLHDLRDKTIVEFKDDAVRQITLRSEKSGLVLSRKAGEWFVDQPKSFPADQTEVHGLISALRSMRAEAFVEESPADLKPYGLDKPRLSVGIIFEGNQAPREISIGGKVPKKDEVYLTLDGQRTVYAVGEEFFGQLNKDLAALRNKAIVVIPSDRIAKVHIQRPKESFSLIRDEKEGWSVEAPSRQRAGETAVADYLSALSRLKAKGFVDSEAKDPKRLGLDPPGLRISVAASDGKPLAVLFLGDPVNGNAHVRRDDQPTIYVVDEFSYQRLNKKPADFVAEETKK